MRIRTVLSVIKYQAEGEQLRSHGVAAVRGGIGDALCKRACGKYTPRVGYLNPKG